jgi:hypothetical protein
MDSPTWGDVVLRTTSHGFQKACGDLIDIVSELRCLAPPSWSFQKHQVLEEMPDLYFDTSHRLYGSASGT